MILHLCPILSGGMRGLAPDTIQPLFLEKEKPAVTLQVTRPAAGKGAGGGAGSAGRWGVLRKPFNQ
ncbi:MAG: hypothetical protein WBJ51_02645 [Methanoculleus sp.]